MAHGRRRSDIIPDAHQNRLGTASFIAVVYLLVIPAFFYSATTGELGLYFLTVEDPGTATLLVAIHTLASVRLGLLSVSPTPPVLRFTFWVFVYIWTANVPALQFTVGALPWRFILPVDSYRYGLTVIAVGLIMYEVGGFIAARRPTAAGVGSGGGLAVKLPSGPRLAALIIFSWLAVVVITYLLGLSAVIASREEVTESIGEETQTQLLVGAFFRSPILVAFFAMLAIAATGAHKRIPYFIPIFAATAVLCLIANFPTAVARAWFGSAVLGSLALVAISRRKNYYGKAGVPLVLALLVIFPLLGQFRRATRLDFTMLQGIEQFVTGDFDVVQMHSAILDFTNYYGLQWGKQLLGPLLFWIPRSYWYEKPVGTGLFVAERMGMPFTNVSAPLWAEAYVNFGILGVIIFFGLYGWFSRRYELRLATMDLDLRAITLVSFLSGFQLFLLRGDLLTSAAFSVPFAVIAAVALKPRRATAPKARHARQLRPRHLHS